MGDMKHYVTEQELFCIKENSIYPQDIQKTENVCLTFGTVGITCTKFTKNGQKTKHINGYQGMSANEINQTFAKMNWDDEQYE